MAVIVIAACGSAGAQETERATGRSIAANPPAGGHDPSAESIEQLNDEAIADYKRHDYADAEKLFKQAIDKAQAADDHKWVGSLLNNLSSVYAAEGKKSEAEISGVEAEAVKGLINKMPILGAQAKLKGAVKQDAVLRNPGPMAGQIDDFGPMFPDGLVPKNARRKMFADVDQGMAAFQQQAMQPVVPRRPFHRTCHCPPMGMPMGDDGDAVFMFGRLIIINAGIYPR